MPELAQIVATQSIALSGTAAPIVAIPQGTQVVIVEIAAEYAAVAATSGITASFSYSNDGTTYVASAAPTIKAAPAVGVVGTATAVLRLGNDPFILDSNGNFPKDIKINLTNLDATNAANVSVAVQTLTHQA